MRAVVYTTNCFFELGLTAKNCFLSQLVPDDDGKFDSVQMMTKELREKVESLTDDDFGMEWRKDSYIAQFKEKFLVINDGDKFLITQDWVGNKLLFRCVEFLNDGYSLCEAQELMKNEKISE